MFKTLIVLSTFASATSDLPPLDIATKYEPTKQMYVSDSLAVPLFEFGTHRWGDVRPEMLPDHIVNAFLAAEDQRFFRHKGVDLKSLFRASVENLSRLAKGSNLLGASTITQQTSKLIFTDGSRTLTRKMREAIMAVRMERTIDKNEILRIYLNEVYFGQGATGLYDASINYFSVPPERLSVAEAAFLATLPKAPSALSSKSKRARALLRRDWVLSRMHTLGMIDKKTRNNSQNEEISFRNKVIVTGNPPQSDYIEDALNQQLDEMFDSWRVKQGGFQITSTINDEWQRAGYRSLRAGLEKYDQAKGWRGPVGQIDMSKRRWRFDFLRKAKDAPLPHWRTALVVDIDDKIATVELVDGGFGRIVLKDQKLLKQVNYKRDVLSTDPEFSLERRSSYIEYGYGANQYILRKGDLIYVRRQDEFVPALTENPDQWHENAMLISKSKNLRAKVPDLELIQRPVIDGGLVAVESDSGRILSMVGGYSYLFSQFNRVTQAKRQPGSTVKPIIYLTAMRKGWNPETIIDDAPLTVRQTGRRAWRPQNYDNRFKGQMLLRDALAQSRNIPAVKTAMHVGLPAISDTAIRLGVYDKPLNGLPAALGAKESTLKKMAGAYATIANGGTLVIPTLIQSIRDRRGRLYYDGFEAFCPACSEESWYKNGQVEFSKNKHSMAYKIAGKVGDLKSTVIPKAWPSHQSPPIEPEAFLDLQSILQDVVTNGTARGIKNRVPKGSGGKTGTTNGFKDAWFVGFSEGITVAVHAGYDQPKSLGRGWTGGRIAAPIYADFVEQTLLRKKPKGGFEGYLASIPPKPSNKPYQKGTRLLANIQKTEEFDSIPSLRTLQMQKPLRLANVPLDDDQNLETPSKLEIQTNINADKN